MTQGTKDGLRVAAIVAFLLAMFVLLAYVWPSMQR